MTRTPADPRILVPCMDWTRASGGVRKLYRIVDVLNSAGLNAAIMHQTPGFRCTWFQHDTPVLAVSEGWPARPRDILLVPEILAWQFLTMTAGAPKVIINQNVYQTFQWRTQAQPIVPYLHPDYLATIVVSEDSRQYLAHAFPRHPVFRMHYSVNPRLFFPAATKRRQIAYMPRKNDSDANQVIEILRCRNALDGFELVRIEDRTEEQAAAMLRESLIFLSFSRQEGWGLPPMEAMACGCITIGYDGRGGREYLSEPYAFPVPDNDVIGFAATVERVIAGLLGGDPSSLERARLASEHIRGTYTPERERDDILGAWSNIIAMIDQRSAGRRVM